MTTAILALTLAQRAELASYLPVRTTPVRVSLLGDSTANPTDVTSPASQDFTVAKSATWQSGTVQIGQSANKWMVPAFYPQAYLVGGGGISGQTTTQMVARDTLAASTTRRAIKDIIDLAPDVVIYRGGSINDLIAVTDSASVATAVATAYANHIEIINRFATANIPVIDVGIYGYSYTGGTAYPGDPVFVRQALVQLNGMYAAFATANPGIVTFVSPTGVVSDAGGAFLTNRAGSSGTGDNGVHLNNWGAYLMDAVQAQALTKLFGPSANVRYRGVNTVADPLFVNNTVQAFGTVNNNLSIGALNTTRQNAKVEVIAGKRFQTCEAVITAASNTLSFNLPFNPTATGLNVANGDIYGFEFDLYIAGLSGFTPNITTELLRIDVRDSVGSGRVVLDIGGAVYPYIAEGVMVRHVAFPPFQFGDVAANLTTASTWNAIIGALDAAGTYKVGIANPRIVKLGQTVVTG